MPYSGGNSAKNKQKFEMYAKLYGKSDKNTILRKTDEEFRAEIRKLGKMMSYYDKLAHKKASKEAFEREYKATWPSSKYAKKIDPNLAFKKKNMATVSNLCGELKPEEVPLSKTDVWRDYAGSIDDKWVEWFRSYDEDGNESF